MEETDMKWRTSSYSSNGGGECVEIASKPGTVAVRDSKRPVGPALAFIASQWQAFTRAVKDD